MQAGPRNPGSASWAAAWEQPRSSSANPASSGATRYAVAVDMGSSVQALDGFELSDLTIDCNLDGAANLQTGGAVRVRGNHVALRRVRVVGHGTRGSGSMFGVLVAAGEGSENCSIESCVVEPAAAAHAGVALLCSLEGSSAARHRFCTVRNCTVRGLAAIDPPPAIANNRVSAISPGYGLGTVIEGCQVMNCAYGVDSLDARPLDVVIWNNFFRPALFRERDRANLKDVYGCRGKTVGIGVGEV